LKILTLTFALLAAVSMAFGEEKVFEVLPWNGHASAVSLTFDDGDPIHLDFAIPEMKKRGIVGTFYLIADNLERREDWAKAAKDGLVEIGNHSATHRHANELTDKDEYEEVDGAGKRLKDLSGQDVLMFAYPFVEITDGLRKRAEINCIAARGGGPEMFYTADTDPDWYNIHSCAAMTDYPFEKYKQWIDDAMEFKGWTVFMIHAIEGSDWWQPIKKDTFTRILDYLKNNRDKVWTAPIGEVAAYWKAQKIVESAQQVEKDGVIKLTWEKPVPFPKGVMLKVKIARNDMVIRQKGIPVPQKGEGIFTVSFDDCELTAGGITAAK
jgi:peptidoglycan/xylan/chitin deacetylase (PgdA/CDA1 family)